MSSAVVLVTSGWAVVRVRAAEVLLDVADQLGGVDVGGGGRCGERGELRDGHGDDSSARSAMYRFGGVLRLGRCPDARASSQVRGVGVSDAAGPIPDGRRPGLRRPVRDDARPAWG